MGVDLHKSRVSSYEKLKKTVSNLSEPPGLINDLHQIVKHHPPFFTVSFNADFHTYKPMQ